MSTILPYGDDPGQWNDIRKLLQTAAYYNFANGQKMTIKGTVCGNVANASNVGGNGTYKNTGTVGGTQWVGEDGPTHSKYPNQPFGCQWWTVLPPACPSPPNQPSDQLFVDIATASNTAKALTPTQTFAGIDTNAGDVTINVVSGLNVINVPANPYGTTEGKLQVRGGNDLIISGPADAVVIFNVGADNEVNIVRDGMSISNGSSVLINGGVLAQNILFNVLGGDVPINAGDVYGNILVRAGSDCKGKATIQGTSFIHGIVIGDGNHSSEFLLDTNAAICGGFAAISVIKEVSPDNGVNWYPADTAPGPDVLSDTNPYFRFTVTNIGTVTLSNVQLTDDVYGPVGVVASLAPGASAQGIYVGAWAIGQQVNTVTVTGDYGEGTFTDSDSAYWVGVQIDAPAIDVLKEVSPDGGTTWYDANSATGPLVLVGTDPQFRFTVTNTGNTALTNVVLTDDVYGLIAAIGPLAVGGTFNTTITRPWQLGQQVNIATATGDFDEQTVSDDDPAFWFGVEEDTPAIKVTKEVSPDDGATWYDANTAPGPDVIEGTDPQIRFTVQNIGTVDLTNVQVNDDVHGFIFGVPSLLVGQWASTEIVEPWALGQQTDTATAAGDYLAVTVSDTDPVYYFGVEAPIPEIAIVKEVSPDSGATWLDANTPPGPSIPYTTSPWFRITVSNPGPVTLTNILVTDDVYGNVGTIDSLPPGMSVFAILVEPWAHGQQTDIATATGEYEGESVTASDSANYLGVIPRISIEKYVSVDNGVTWLEADMPPGPFLPKDVIVQFKYTVTNTGEVILSDIAVVDDVLGSIGNIPSLEPNESFDFIA